MLPTWDALWATARFDLELPTVEFLSLTPRLFDALRKRLERDHQREEVLTGIVAAQVGNFSMAAPKRPFRPDDFVFTNPPKREAEMPQTSAAMLSIFDRVAGQVKAAK